METLVYHAGALGDFLTILPTLRAWRRLDPGGRLTLLGRPGFGELARDGGLIDGVWDLERADAAHLFAARPLPPPVSGRLRGFALAFVFAAADSPLVAHLKAAIPMVLHQPPFPADRTHVVDYHLSLPPEPETTILCQSTALAPEAAALVPEPDRTVLLHAGSGSPRKNWPFHSFQALAGRLMEQGLQTVWLHGPAEPELPYPPCDAVVRGLPLPILAQLFAACRLYVGNDSGISHLAAACGCPAVLLFGASDPLVWAPRGRKVTMVTGAVPCAPCHPHVAADLARCRQQCLAGIPVATVFEACRQRLGGERR
jgi:heptosyltransferase III